MPRSCRRHPTGGSPTSRPTSATPRNTSRECSGSRWTSWHRRRRPPPGHSTDSEPPGGLRSGLVELAREKLFQLGKHQLRILARREELDLRALAGRKHHEAHDALSIDLLLVLLDEDLGFELVGDAHDHRGWARVYPELVLDDKLLDHGLACGGCVCGIHVRFDVKKYAERRLPSPARPGLQLKNQMAASLRMPRLAIIVPCRLESKRFPKKLLHKISGKPLLSWVADRIARVAPDLDLWFAVDDPLLEIGRAHGTTPMTQAARMAP